MVVPRLLENFTCVVLYRSADAWQELERAVGASDRLIGITADLADEASVNGAVEEARARVGLLYGLVHLAGGFEGGTVADTSLESWNRQIQTNLTNAFIAVRAVLPQLQQQGFGRIVAVGSSAVATRPAGLAGYVVSKAGLNVLIEVLARELKDTGITANIVLPASLATPAMREGTDAARLVPLERVAAAIDFLLSDSAASITGASIPLTVTGT